MEFLLFLFFVSLLEPIIVNFVYFSNISLFVDIILTKKNRDKLYNFYKNKIIESKVEKNEKD